jgi:hypothetical protein
MLENSEGAIKTGQSRETGNIGCTRWSQAKQDNPEKLATRRRKTNQKHHNAQTNTNSVNKTWALLQTTWRDTYLKYLYCIWKWHIMWHINILFFI